MFGPMINATYAPYMHILLYPRENVNVHNRLSEKLGILSVGFNLLHF